MIARLLLVVILLAYTSANTQESSEQALSDKQKREFAKASKNKNKLSRLLNRWVKEAEEVSSAKAIVRHRQIRLVTHLIYQQYKDGKPYDQIVNSTLKKAEELEDEFNKNDDIETLKAKLEQENNNKQFPRNMGLTKGEPVHWTSDFRKFAHEILDASRKGKTLLLDEEAPPKQTDEPKRPARQQGPAGRG